MKIEVIRAGIQTTVQDLGRPGLRRHGVSAGGALDPLAARTANLLVGNAETEAVLETALAGLHLRFTDDRVAAWCGANFDALRNGERLPAGRAFHIGKGDELRFRGLAAGMRGWLAISGGIDVPLVLESRSTDLRGGFGGFNGRALADGDALPLGTESALSQAIRRVLGSDGIATWGAGAELAKRGAREGLLRIVRGPEWVRFNSVAHAAFFSKPFTVGPDSDRMGLRLSGPELVASNSHSEMISQGVIPGTVQVPTQGEPIILLADCQTIGGYPRLAHVITADLPRVAQLRPGDQVSFREINGDDARALLASTEEGLRRLRIGLQLRVA